MNRPPSQAVIEAVELALTRQDLIDSICGCDDLRCGENARRSEDIYEVAKAAMDAARPIILREAAERFDWIARYGIEAFPSSDVANAAAQSLTHWAAKTETGDKT